MSPRMLKRLHNSYFIEKECEKTAMDGNCSTLTENGFPKRKVLSYFGFNHLMECADPLKDVINLLRHICVRWSIDDEGDHTLGTKVESKGR